MKLCVLGSGSRGNAVLLQSGNTRLLIDAGFGTRTIAKRLHSIGVDPRSISAVIVTHEHTDHAKGAAAGAARWGWQIFATAGTSGASLTLGDSQAHTLVANQPVKIGDAEVWPISTSHDATDPVAVVATDMTNGVRAAIVYDLGLITEPLQKAIEHVEMLVIESNHDSEMLRNGPYPVSLKRRIAGIHGHLSNRAAGAAAARCAHRGLAHVVLAHLSEINNTPLTAAGSMQRVLSRTAFRGTITAAAQDKPSRPLSASRSAAFCAVQLSLGL